MLRATSVVSVTLLLVALGSVSGRAHPAANGVTWNGTVARLLDRRCLTCHGGDAAVRPRLDGYERARAAADAIKQSVLTRRMPRWDAVNGVREYTNDPRLTPYEIGLLADWADEGAPLGNNLPGAAPAAAPRPVPPDVVLRVPAKYVVNDAEHTFDLSNPATTTQWIRGWEIEPGNRTVVRSAIVTLASGEVLGTWVAGEARTMFAAGVAVPLQPGETIRLTMHYARPHGRVADASAVGLFLMPMPAARLEQLNVPCGELTLPSSIRALAIRPALDADGASLRVIARHPGGGVEPLGWFEHYSADAPRTYWFRDPPSLAAGTIITATAAHGACAATLDYVSTTAAIRPLASHDVAAARDTTAVAGDDESAPSGWACPMHPDVLSEQPGACPICQMTMIPRGPREEGAYELRASMVRAHDGSNTLRLRITDPRDGSVVRRFEKVHERPIHLFILSDDLTQFAHVHPTALPDGTLVVRHAPVTSGDYRVFADFLPVGGTPQLLQQEVFVGAAGRPTASRQAAIAPDLSDKIAGDLRARIDIEPRALAAGNPGLIDFVLTDARTGAPVTDLEPYLGAWGHMFIVSADLTDAVHSHPIAPLTSPFGSRVVFNQRFPKAGLYRLWAQFQRHGHVITLPFTVAVN